MKRSLLLVALVISSMTSAQSLDLSNEPAIGETSNMFLCDSFAVNYEAITGSGVTWDYSTLLGYAGSTQVVEVVNATTTTEAASYPTSVKALKIGNSIMTYFNSTAASRVSQGFIFTEPSLGDVVSTFENDNLTMMDYPFSFGSTTTDTYSGTVDFVFNMIPINEPLTGNSISEIDGSGTMLFPNGVTVNNVIRLRTIDTSSTDLTAMGAGIMDIARDQYEYYDLANQNLPIFIHSTITILQAGTTLLIAPLVLSLYEGNYLGINETEAFTFAVYPNPSNDYVIVEGEFTNETTAKVVDQSGRIVLTPNVISGQPIDISSLENGVYMIAIQNNGSTATKTIIKK